MDRRLLVLSLSLSLSLALVVGLTAGCASEPENGGPRLPDAEPDMGQEVPSERRERAPADTAAAPALDLPVLLERIEERSPGGELRVLDELGPPLRTEREPVRNRHDPEQTDTIRTLVYDGLRIEVYDVSGSGREMVRRLEVTSDDYETAEGLAVGSQRTRVRQALGDPDRTEGEVLYYEVYESEDDPTPTQLGIRFDGERVAAMTWEFYVD